MVVEVVVLSPRVYWTSPSWGLIPVCQAQVRVATSFVRRGQRQQRRQQRGAAAAAVTLQCSQWTVQGGWRVQGA